MNTEEVINRVKAELGRIAQADIVAAIEALLVEPRMELRGWDYGEPDQQFPCWIVIEDQASNTCIAYCEQGFGPRNPWGLLFFGGEHLSMGMDAGWFSKLEDAVRDSPLWHGAIPDGYEVQ